MKFRKLLVKMADSVLVKQKHHNIVLKQYREAQCRQCEHFDEENLECKACGCLLDVKWESLVNVKISTGRAEITHCVKGRWNDKELADHYSSKN